MVGRIITLALVCCGTVAAGCRASADTGATAQPGASAEPPAPLAETEPTAEESESTTPTFMAGFRRYRQCNLLIEALNGHTRNLMEAMERLTSNPVTPDAAKEYSDIVQAVIDDVEGIELTDQNVAGFAERYVTMFRDAQELGPLFEATPKNAAAYEEFLEKSLAIQRAEETLVSEVNAYCQDEAPEHAPPVETP